MLPVDTISSSLTQFYPQYQAQILVFQVGHLLSQNDVTMSLLRLTATSNYFLHPYKTFTKCLSTLICCQQAYSSSLTQLYPHFLALRFLGSGSLVSQNDVIASWLRLTATSNCFLNPHQTYTKCLSTLICCPQAYSSSLTQLSFLLGSDVGVLGCYVESKCCQYVMVEADSNLKLLPTSISYIYKVFEHIDMLSIGIRQQPYTVIPTLLGSDLGVLGHMWSLPLQG